MKRTGRHLVLFLVAAGTVAGPKPALGTHDHAMRITSEASGGGPLRLGWDFEGMPIARTSDSGLAGVFTGDVPAFDDGTGDGVSTFTLVNGTQVSVEIMSIDENIRWIFSEVPPTVFLNQPGQTAPIGTMPNLHNHATFEITGADEKEFLEGRISFRLFESTPVPLGYTPSTVHTLRVSNGYLPPLETATAADLKCQQAVAGAVRGLIGKQYKILSKCLDKVFEHILLGASAGKALKACSIDDLDPESMVNDLEAQKTKAIEKIEKKCGTLSNSSVPYTESHIHTHLGMARCRAEEMAGALYNHAAEMLGEILEDAGLGDHHDVQHEFPCMKASVE